VTICHTPKQIFQENEMKTSGFVALVISAILMLIGLFMDTTVSTEFGSVHNIGLMNEKQNILIFGGLLSIISVLLIGLAKLEQIKLSSIAQPPVAHGERKCPFCAELIKADAVICRFCQRDLPTETTYKRSAESKSDNDQQLPQTIEAKPIREPSEIRVSIASIEPSKVVELQAAHPEISRFFNAIRYGKIKQVQEMVSTNPAFVLTKDAFGNTPLEVAEKENNQELKNYFESCLM